MFLINISEFKKCVNRYMMNIRGLILIFVYMTEGTF